MPADFADTLSIYADEAELRTMLADIDELEDDVVEFVRDKGVDWPKHDA